MSDRIYQFDTLCSTSETLKQLVSNGAPSGTVVIAKQQTSGRGTHERSFESPAGGLYLSYYQKVSTSPETTMEITKWTASSVHKAIQDMTGVNLQIKYVNDLLYEGRKVCGILTELSGTRLILGIGINVNTSKNAYSPDLRSSAVSLKEITGEEISLSGLTDAILQQLDAQFQTFPGTDWREEYYTAHLICETLA